VFRVFGWEVPDLMDAFDLVTLFDGFDKFWGALRTGEHTLFESVRTTMRLLQELFGHYLFHTTLAEWKHEFSLVVVGKDGMIQFVGR